MASHAVRRLIACSPIAADDPAAEPRVAVIVELTCGCQVERTIAADRIVQRPDGERFAVGKMPCPRGHAVHERV